MSSRVHSSRSPHRSFPLPALALLLMAAPLSAQQPRSVTSPQYGAQLTALEEHAKQLETAIARGPDRTELKIKLQEPQKIKLFKADPKLLENKFVASIQLQMGRPGEPGGSPSRLATFTSSNLPRLMRDLPKELSELGGSMASPGVQALSFSERFRVAPLDEVFKLLAAHCPEDKRPGAKLIEFLTSRDVERDVRHSYSNTASGSAAFYQVFATTAEEAETRLKAIVQLIDYGYCFPLQQHCLTEMKKALEAAREGEKALGKTNELVAAEEKKLALPSEISPDILSKLKAEKIMMDIELAGLAARIKACATMLEQSKSLTPSTVQGVNDLKVRAEIEQIGVKEKLGQINKLIAEGDARDEAKNRSQTLRNELMSIRQQKIRPMEQRAADYAILAQRIAPSEIENNQIPVSPVEWTN